MIPEMENWKIKKFFKEQKKVTGWGVEPAWLIPEDRCFVTALQLLITAGDKNCSYHKLNFFYPFFSR